MNECIFDIDPVSYTHLDVYKRQIDKLCETFRLLLLTSFVRIFVLGVILCMLKTAQSMVGHRKKSGAEIVLQHRLYLFLISHLTLQEHSPFLDHYLWLS